MVKPCRDRSVIAVALDVKARREEAGRFLALARNRSD